LIIKNKTLYLDGSPASVTQAANLLRQGEVVGLPSETVYGLAGNAFSAAAVIKIFAAKDRPSFDPLIVHLSQTLLSLPPETRLEQLVEQKIIHAEVLTWPARKLIESAFQKFWPGPLTFILPKGSKIPDEVTSGQTTVALRMPQHPLFQAILSECAFPLAAPSANRFGRISPTEANHVAQELDGRIAAVIDGGPCSVGVESSIVRIENPLQVTLLRPGKISATDLESHFGVPVRLQPSLGEKNTLAQLAPGMLDEHYAPRKPLLLFPHPFAERASLKVFLKNSIPGPTTAKIGYLGMSEIPIAPGEILSPRGELLEMAKNLFGSLRRLDSDPTIELIIADLPIEATSENSGDHPLTGGVNAGSGIAAAIADRLNRASKNKPLSRR
jgi:L-threonylcarbamoyladenylate synthase